MIINDSSIFSPSIPDQRLLQPNAVDITCDQLFEHTAFSRIYLKDKPEHAPQIPMGFFGRAQEQVWELLAGRAYPFISDLKVEMPSDQVGWLISRSTLNRNGMFILSGLYDSGFRGNIAGTIYCFNDSYIEKGSPIAQFVQAKAQTRYLYNGQYQEKKVTE